MGVQWWSNGGFDLRVVDGGGGRRIWWGEIAIGVAAGVSVWGSRAPPSGGRWWWRGGGRPRMVDRGVVVHG